MPEIVLLSGKGGTGKTSLAAAFATLEKNLVVADCDVDAANLYLVLQPEDHTCQPFITGYKARIDYNSCTQCGLCMEYCRFGAISVITDPAYPKGKITISHTACDGCKLCARICPIQAISMIPSDKSLWFAGNFRNGKMVHARLAPGEENSGKLVSLVREKARQTAKETGWQRIIIDGPPGTGCSAIASMTGTDKVIVVTEPSRSGFHDMKRILELVHQFRIPSCVIINKFTLNKGFTRDIENWCLENNIQVAGKISFSPDIVHAMVHCASITEWKPSSETASEIKAVYNKIILPVFSAFRGSGE